MATSGLTPPCKHSKKKNNPKQEIRVVNCVFIAYAPLRISNKKQPEPNFTFNPDCRGGLK